MNISLGKREWAVGLSASDDATQEVVPHMIYDEPTLLHILYNYS